MKIKIKNKKANTTMIVVGIIISVLSFFVISNFIFNTSNTVVTQSDDIACRALVSALDLSKMELPIFLYKLEEKCKIDESQTINLNNKEESFKTLSNDLERCFYRYGDGKKDFMSDYKTTGDWCFTCAKVKYKDNDKQIKYQKFIDWTKENPKNLGKDEKTYFNKINIVYSNKKVSPELRSEYEDLKEEMKDETSLFPLFSVISEQINYIDDLNGKTLDSNDKELFVVFRYDRLQKTFEEKKNDAESYATYGMVTGLIVGSAAEYFTEIALSTGTGAAIGAVSGGITAVPGAIVGFVVGVIKVTIKIVVKTPERFEKVLKIRKLSEKVKDLVKFSKTEKVAKLFIDVTGKIKKFSVSIKSIEYNIKNYKALGYSENYFNKLTEVKKLMDDLGIKDLNKIDKVKKLNQKELKNFEKILDGRNWENWNKKTDGDLFEKIILNEADKNKMIKLQKLAFEELDLLKKGEKIEIPNIKDYIKVGLIFGGGAGGIFFSTQINNNYNQYVDIMTPEQYYRLCGPEPSNYK